MGERVDTHGHGLDDVHIASQSILLSDTETVGNRECGKPLALDTVETRMRVLTSLPKDEKEPPQRCTGGGAPTRRDFLKTVLASGVIAALQPHLKAIELVAARDNMNSLVELIRAKHARLLQELMRRMEECFWATPNSA